MTTFHEKSGNIFSTGAQTIVITVNCVGIMGAGIAQDAKYRWPLIYDSYAKKCSLNQFGIGEILWETSESQFVALFPTKTHWRMPSKIGYIKSGLQTLRKDIIEKSINSVALPYLGCSNGGLEWAEVKPLIKTILSEISDLEVELWEFSQDFVDKDFEKFRDVYLALNNRDALSWLKFSKKTEKLIRNTISNNQITNFVQLSMMKGVGDKTLKKIYEAALGRSYPTVQTPLNFSSSTK